MGKIGKVLISMSIIINIIFILLICIKVIGKVKSLGEEKPTFSTMHNIKKSLYDSLTISSNDIVFIGDSITDSCEISEVFEKENLKNRGISGDTTIGVLDTIDDISKGKPEKIFILIGINDLCLNSDINTFIDNYKKIIDTINENSPNTKILIQSILPVNEKLDTSNITNEIIENVNLQLKSFSDDNIEYIDLYSIFIDSNNQLNLEYTTDGIHLSGDGYLKWREIIKEYI